MRDAWLASWGAESMENLASEPSEPANVLLIHWNPAITKCYGTEKNVRYSEDPAITNYLVYSNWATGGSMVSKGQ